MVAKSVKRIVQGLARWAYAALEVLDLPRISERRAAAGRQRNEQQRRPDRRRR